MSAPIDKQKRPKVGVGVLVLSKHHPNCVLIGKRKGKSPGEGQYALPGGHLEFGESWETCAYRETLEETGLRLTDLQYYAVVNAIEVDKDYHYVTLFVKGEVDYSNGNQQEPTNLEPEKCEAQEKVNRNNIKWNGMVNTDVACITFTFRLAVAELGPVSSRESWEACAIRETMEETGLILNNVRLATVANGLVLANDYHYLELYMIGEVDTHDNGEAKNMEPDKCEGWYWMPWSTLPPSQELFFPLRLLRDIDFNPFQYG